MADISEILTMEDAEDYAIGQLRSFARSILPDRSMYLFTTEYPTSTTEYLLFEKMQSVTGSGLMGDRPMHYEMDKEGNETYVYDATTTIMISAYIGSAYYDLKTLKQMLNNKHMHYTYFGATKGLVGITNIREVLNTPVLIDGTTEYQPCATLILDMNYPYKVVNTYGEYVSSINFTTNTKTPSATSDSGWDTLSSNGTATATTTTSTVTISITDGVIDTDPVTISITDGTITD